MKPKSPLGRSAGVVVPLFSLHTARSWGIGDIADLARCQAWLRRAGLQAVQVLPLGTLPPGETSPYSALSAMAIDPIYVAVDQAHDFQALGGDARLPLDEQIALRRARSSPHVAYGEVREVKESALRLAFSLFWDVDWVRTTARAGAFAAFASWEDWWLGDYALYSALRARHGNRPWTQWPAQLRDRDPDALDTARRELEQDVLFHQYVQWVADEQWELAREQLGAIRLFGDFPFMVSTDSADVWANQHLFRFDRTVGTPPDAFSETGQDWGLPLYRWDVMHAEDYRWLRQRGKRMARLFDGYRVDHLVGFFRTYSRPLGEIRGSFDPAAKVDQIALGERLLTLFLESGAQVIAEDLGLIPDFVRESMARLGVPGYKVLRWERKWKVEGQPFIDPASYPAISVVATSTHDIEPLALWWETIDEEERRAFMRLLDTESSGPPITDLNVGAHGVRPRSATTPFTPAVRDALLNLAYAAGSDLLLAPIQDLFGWPDRINTPATVGGQNWTWRLPLAVDALESDPVAIQRADALRALAQRTGRL